jgi:protocatechuate 3,4-dioxygenase beta subunit
VAAGRIVARDLAFVVGATLTGKVSVKRGDVSEVRVELVPTQSGWLVWGTAAVSSDGTYRVEHLAPGEYTIAACREGERGTSTETIVGAGPEAAGPELRLGFGASVRGRLVDAQGQPIAGDKLSLERAEAKGGIGSWEATTDARGFFEILDVPEGTFAFSIWRREGEGSFSSSGPRRDVTVEQDDVALGDVAVGWSLATKVVGRVLGPDGAPVDSADVEVLANRASPFERHTDALGAFSVEGLDPGAVRVRARKGELVTVAPVPVTVASNRAHEVVLRLVKGGTITGRVRLPEKRFVRVVAVATRHDEDAPHDELPVERDDDGRFRVEGLVPGEWRVVVMGVCASQPVAVASGGEVTVDLDLASAVEKVSIEIPALPRAIRFEGSARWTGQGGGSDGMDHADWDGKAGTAAFKWVAPGPVDVEMRASVRAQTWYFTTRLVVVAGGGASWTLPWPRADEAGGLEGRVDPSTGWHAVWLHGDKLRARASLERDGSFRFEHLVPGRYRVFRSGLEPADVDPEKGDLVEVPVGGVTKLVTAPPILGR